MWVTAPITAKAIDLAEKGDSRQQVLKTNLIMNTKKDSRKISRQKISLNEAPQTYEGRVSRNRINLLSV